MVEQTKKENKSYYKCEICKFYYESMELAQKCEAFCREHNSCSLEITKHAVKID